jgi:hypothetical protein
MTGAAIQVPWRFRLERPPVRTAIAVSGVLDHYIQTDVNVTLVHVQWEGQSALSWWLRPGKVTDAHPLLMIDTGGRIYDIGTAFYTPSLPRNVGGEIVIGILAARGLVAPASAHMNRDHAFGEGFAAAVARLRDGDVQPRFLTSCQYCGQEAALTYKFLRCTFCLAPVPPQAYRPLSAGEEPPLGGTGATAMTAAAS